MKKLILISLVLFVLCFGFASAANCGGDVQCICGDTLTSSQVMWYDLDCSSNGLYIGANDLTLDCDGHTIRASTSDPAYGVILDSKQGVTVKNCEVIGGKDFGNWGHGIVLLYSSNNDIFDNIAKDHNGWGVDIYESYENRIYNNYLTNNQEGVRIWAENPALSFGNTFWENTFINNDINANEEGYIVNNYWNIPGIGNYWDDYSDTGIYEIYGLGDGIDYYPSYPTPALSCGDTITEDTLLTEDLTDCPNTGLIIGADGITLDCNHHLIEANSAGYGIHILDRNDVTVVNCTTTGGYYGIFVQNSNYNNLTGNLNYDCNDGIKVAHSSNNNILLDNIVRDNIRSGIYMENNGDTNTVSGNLIKNNGQYGVYLQSTSNYNTFWNNQFISNSVNAYEGESSNLNNWDYVGIGNYWDDYSGTGYYFISGEGGGVDHYPLGLMGDVDGDGILDEEDNCPFVYNSFQWDFDNDGVGDWCDNCPLTKNLLQIDLNNNERGDACEGLFYSCRTIQEQQMNP